MSDTMRDDFDAMRAHRKQKHAEWKERNLKTLLNSNNVTKLTIKSDGEVVLLREPGKPKVDFYPSTGRWRAAGQAKTYRGGAEAFLNWYAKQR